MADTSSLLNCRTGNCTGGSNPPLSAKQNKPRVSGVVYFTKNLKKACFLKVLKENKHNLSGFVLLCRVPPKGITGGNPYNKIPASDAEI